VTNSSESNKVENINSAGLVNAGDVRIAVRESSTPYGKSGQAFNVASEADLNSLFSRITFGARNVSANYDGEMKILSDGTRIGLRNSSSTGGQVIDIFPVNGKSYKVHIAQ
jgi:filamentous hemagglutinin